MPDEPRPRTFEEVVAAEGPAKRAWRQSGDSFEDVTVGNAFHREVSVLEDREGTGDWRVEFFDDDGGCYVTVFAGPKAEKRARDYFDALRFGRLRTVRANGVGDGTNDGNPPRRLIGRPVGEQPTDE